MKQPTTPSKVIIIPQTPQNNPKQVEAPKTNTPVEAPAPPQGPAQQEASAETAEEEAE